MEISKEEPEDSVADKNTVLSLMQKGYEKVNRFKGQSCFTDSDGQPVVFRYDMGDAR